MTIRAVCAVLALLTAGAHAGNIYQCKGKDGVPVYQNIPCKNPRAQVSHKTFRDGETSTESSWKRAVEGFAQVHPEILMGSNLGLLQKEIHAVARPDLGDWEVLRIAYDRARARPDWQTRKVAARSRRPAIGKSGSVLPHDPGLGASAYARGEIVGMRCTRPSGAVYYAEGECWTSTVPTGKLIAYDAQTGREIRENLPDRGAQVFDPVQGRYRDPSEIRWERQYRVVRDHGVSVSADAACDGAQAFAEKHNSARARRAVERLCEQGRSLQETRPSRGSLYYTPSQGK